MAQVNMDVRRKLWTELLDTITGYSSDMMPCPARSDLESLGATVFDSGRVDLDHNLEKQIDTVSSVPFVRAMLRVEIRRILRSTSERPRRAGATYAGSSPEPSVFAHYVDRQGQKRWDAKDERAPDDNKKKNLRHLSTSDS